MSSCSFEEIKHFFAIVSTLLAIIFTWFASWDCSFFRAAEPLPNHFPPLIVERGFGLWTVSDAPNLPISRGVVTCVMYTHVEPPLDGALKFSQAMSMIAMILSIPFLVAVTINLFRRPTRQATYQYQAYGILAGCVLTISLSFVAMASTHCTSASMCWLGSAGYNAICALLFWIVTALFLLRMRVEEPLMTHAAMNIQHAPAPGDKNYDMPSIEVTEEGTDEEESLAATSSATVVATYPNVRVERRSLTGGKAEITTTKQHPDGSTTVTQEIIANNELVDVAL